jgi:hypothetical protein
MLIRTHGSVGEVNEKENKLAKKFLSATPAERIKQIKKIIDSDTAKVDAFKFISELEQVIDEAVKQGNTTPESFGEIYTVKSYLSDTSPAVKMLLEHLACTLPLIK